MANVQGEFISQRGRKKHDFPRYHTGTGTFRFSLSQHRKININTAKLIPIPLKLADLKLNLEAVFCYALTQTLFTN